MSDPEACFIAAGSGRVHTTATISINAMQHNNVATVIDKMQHKIVTGSQLCLDNECIA